MHHTNTRTANISLCSWLDLATCRPPSLKQMWEIHTASTSNLIQLSANNCTSCEHERHHNKPLLANWPTASQEPATSKLYSHPDLTTYWWSHLKRTKALPKLASTDDLRHLHEPSAISKLQWSGVEGVLSCVLH